MGCGQFGARQFGCRRFRARHFGDRLVEFSTTKLIPRGTDNIQTQLFTSRSARDSSAAGGSARNNSAAGGAARGSSATGSWNSQLPSWSRVRPTTWLGPPLSGSLLPEMKFPERRLRHTSGLWARGTRPVSCRAGSTGSSAARRSRAEPSSTGSARSSEPLRSPCTDFDPWCVPVLIPKKFVFIRIDDFTVDFT